MASPFYMAVQVPEKTLPGASSLFFVSFDNLSGTTLAEKRSSAITVVQNSLGKSYPPNQVVADIAYPFEVKNAQIVGGTPSIPSGSPMTDQNGNTGVTETGDFLVTE